MDINYTILRLEEQLKQIVKTSSNKKRIIEDIMNEKDSSLLDTQEREFLNNYSKKTIHIVLEKLIMLSLENNARIYSYFERLKDKSSNVRRIMLTHFYDPFINDLKKENATYKQKPIIEEIKTFYDKEIEESLKVIQNMDNLILNTSTITLNHMQNRNANGRTVSVKNEKNEFVKKGGIFLTKNSKIGYATFVNKKEFLDQIKNTQEVTLSTGTIKTQALKKLIEQFTGNLKIEKLPSKKQDIRQVKQEDKTLGNLFLGKNLDLENGEYISLEELTFALNKYMRKKEEDELKQIVKPVRKLKKVAAIVAITTALLTSKDVYAKEVTQEETLDHEKEPETKPEIKIETTKKEESKKGTVKQEKAAEKRKNDTTTKEESIEDTVEKETLVETSQLEKETPKVK